MARKLEDDVCAAFAQGKAAHATRQKKTIWTDGVRIYSYAMPIAWWVYEDGEPTEGKIDTCRHEDCAQSPELRAACASTMRLRIEPEARRFSKTTGSHVRAVESSFQSRLER